MTKMLEFHLEDQMLSGGFPVVSDSRNIVFAHFVLDIEPTGSVTAIFRGPTSKPYCVLLDESHICEIPWEVLVLSEKTATSYFSVSLVIGERLTTSCAIVPLIPSGYAEGETPEPPTPSVYEKILNSIKTPYIGENGNWYEWDMNIQTFIDTGIKSTGADGQKGDSGDAYVLTDADKAEIANMVDVNGVIYLPSAEANYQLLKELLASGKEVILVDDSGRYYHCQNNDDQNIIFRNDGGIGEIEIKDYSESYTYEGTFFTLTSGDVTEKYNPFSSSPVNGYAVADALTTIKQPEELKHLKTITLEEAVSEIVTTFEKPLKEIYIVFTGTLDGLTADVTDCILACNTNGGSQYFFYKSSCKFITTADRVYIAHAKEIVERRWETTFAGNTLGVGTTGGMQGLDASSGNPRISYSTRMRDGMTRYVESINFFVYGGKYSFAVGSTLEIYGVEG